MRLVKCSRDHYYDGDRFATCPHCSGGGLSVSEDPVTIAMPSGGFDNVTIAVNPGTPKEMVLRNEDDDPVTVKKENAENLTVPDWSEVMNRAQNLQPASGDEGETVSYYSQKITRPVLREPVVGWLVCTAGKYFGQSFSLKSGRNFIGRSTGMDVCLEGENSVSRERHAVIVYEPLERVFIAQPGDSRELFYVNDNVVLDNVVLKPYDVISLGKVNLIMVPCCTSEFAWEDLAEKEEKE